MGRITHHLDPSVRCLKSMGKLPVGINDVFPTKVNMVSGSPAIQLAGWLTMHTIPLVISISLYSFFKCALQGATIFLAASYYRINIARAWQMGLGILCWQQFWHSTITIPVRQFWQCTEDILNCVAPRGCNFICHPHCSLQQHNTISGNFCQPRIKFTHTIVCFGSGPRPTC